MGRIAKPAEWFDKILPEIIVTNPEKINGFCGVLNFTIQGGDGGKWNVDIAEGKIQIHKGLAENAGFNVDMKDENFVLMVNGELSGPQALMTGKLKFKGELSQAMKIRGLIFSKV